MSADGKADRVAAAIAAVNAPTITLERWQVTIDSTGRPALLSLPPDITDGEIAEPAGWLLTTFRRAKLQARARPVPSLVVARGNVPRA